MKYGEILFLGKCNAKCYYCIGKEMSTLENDVEKLYLSSVNTEPMMYKYLDS